MKGSASFSKLKVNELASTPEHHPDRGCEDDGEQDRPGRVRPPLGTFCVYGGGRNRKDVRAEQADAARQQQAVDSPVDQDRCLKKVERRDRRWPGTKISLTKYCCNRLDWKQRRDDSRRPAKRVRAKEYPG